MSNFKRDKLIQMFNHFENANSFVLQSSGDFEIDDQSLRVQGIMKPRRRRILHDVEMPEQHEEDLREAFSVFDKDGSGELERGDLRYVLTHYGNVLSQGEVTDLLGPGDMPVRVEDLVCLLCDK
ncbi:hypothetical protein LAZ67_8000193 [Cordylochernes scorpioides]|uniref:EF-hand domain-containing protein n=1 Tax=Cordylochernes scorpioides TaxID=51811 RepID=A0ABY6KP56_9ARAC|nr:hypothetical protein LAZ67_8000193 [Cordylochernes scorpioides]